MAKVINIAKIAKKNGLTTAYALQKALKCSPTMANRLWKGDFKQISLKTIQSLCNLFNCNSSELLIITPKNSARPVIEKIPLVESEEAALKPVLSELTNKGEISSSDELTTEKIGEFLGLQRRTVIDYFEPKGKLKRRKGKRGQNFVKLSDFRNFLEAEIKFSHLLTKFDEKFNP